MEPDERRHVPHTASSVTAFSRSGSGYSRRRAGCRVVRPHGSHVVDSPESPLWSCTRLPRRDRGSSLHVSHGGAHAAPRRLFGRAPSRCGLHGGTGHRRDAARGGPPWGSRARLGTGARDQRVSPHVGRAVAVRHVAGAVSSSTPFASIDRRAGGGQYRTGTGYRSGVPDEVECGPRTRLGSLSSAPSGRRSSPS